MTDPDTIETYESVVEEYRERHADRSIVADLVEGFLARVEETATPARIADAGCGPGWETATFADRGHDPVGIDLTQGFVEAAREEAPGADLARMDMRDLAFRDDAFDGLWACASFLHVPRAGAPDTLAGFARVLRPGGVLCLSVKRGEGTREGDAYQGDDRRFVLYEPGELRDLVSDAGFEIETVETGEAKTGEWVVVYARSQSSVSAYS